MRQRVRAFVLLALVVLAGCVGSGPPAAAPPTAEQTTAPTTPTATPTASTLPDETAGERAIAAEKARIRDELLGSASLTGLSFGILRPAEYTVRSRNASGVVVAVTVGYSMEFDCGLAVGGAATKTWYVVTAVSTRLVAVTQDVSDADFCS
jgi:hypothetical protein